MSSSVRASPRAQSVTQNLPSRPLDKPVEDKLAKMKLFPLYSRATITSLRGRASSNSPSVITFEVKSISSDKLDDSMFVVPTDYHKSP